MNNYPTPDNEAERIEFLQSLSLIDSAPDKNFDRINLLTQRVFDVEIAAVTLLDEDRQWFKCIVGLDADETSRDAAICNYTIVQDDIFEVPDLRLHPELSESALVAGPPHLRYYAGAPLSVNGFKLGSLCILDFVPRPPLTDRQRTILKDLASMVVREITVQSIVKESLALLSSQSERKFPE